MIGFIIGLAIGVFLIPTIKETKHWLCFYKLKGILKEPLVFAKDICNRMITGGY